ncbi:MAG: MoaD/ThiS family protein [Methanophagales archaeon]|nr:MoaD/ThiS family protein [Methanophagales archaeon]
MRGAKEEEKRVEVSDEETYESVLEKLGINPVEVVVLRDGKPVPEDEKVVVSGKKGEVKIKVVRIVSGG